LGVKVFTNLERYGHTSAASIPIALCEAIEKDRVQNKDKLVMVGFGGGLTWGATVVEWGMPMPYKQRGWWYKTIRWMLYHWARVRSATIRLSRWLENLLPQDDETVYRPATKEKPKDETDKLYRSNEVKSGLREAPTELPVYKPTKIEEKVMEVERPLHGK
jgi:hypothetical protein